MRKGLVGCCEFVFHIFAGCEFVVLEQFGKLRNNTFCSRQI